MAVDWGSVADWVSGLGSLGAVVVALWITTSDRKRTRLERHDARRLDAQTESDIFVEALFLWARISAAAQDLRNADGGRDYTAAKEQWLIETSAVFDTAIRLQQLPKITVGNYREFENVIQLMRIPCFRRGFHIDEFRRDSPLIKQACDRAPKRIIEGASPLAPIAWELAS